MTNYIWITTQKEMFHKYLAAPEELGFLRDLHRHIFHFKIYLEVFHEDRDVEFILFKRGCNRVINEMDKNLDIKSCEMISYYLAKKIQKQFPKRDIKIEVSEDGENGSLYSYPKSKPLNTS